MQLEQVIKKIAPLISEDTVLIISFEWHNFISSCSPSERPSFNRIFEIAADILQKGEKNALIMKNGKLEVKNTHNQIELESFVTNPALVNKLKEIFVNKLTRKAIENKEKGKWELYHFVNQIRDLFNLKLGF